MESEKNIYHIWTVEYDTESGAIKSFNRKLEKGQIYDNRVYNAAMAFYHTGYVISYSEQFNIDVALTLIYKYTIDQEYLIDYLAAVDLLKIAIVCRNNDIG